MSSYRLLVTRGRRPDEPEVVVDFDSPDDDTALALARGHAVSYVDGREVDWEGDRWRFFTLQRDDETKQSTVATWMPTPQSRA